MLDCQIWDNSKKKSLAYKYGKQYSRGSHYHFQPQKMTVQGLLWSSSKAMYHFLLPTCRCFFVTSLPLHFIIYKTLITRLGSTYCITSKKKFPRSQSDKKVRHKFNTSKLPVQQEIRNKATKQKNSCLTWASHWIERQK